MIHKVFYPVANETELSPGEAKLVTIGGGEECVLYRTPDGRFFATGSLCPHQNEPLDQGHLEDCEVVCRRHHLRFDVRDGNCTNAGGFSVQTFEVRLEGSQVSIGRWEDE